MKSLSQFLKVFSIIALMLFVGSCSQDEDAVLDEVKQPQSIESTKSDSLKRAQFRAKIEHFLAYKEQNRKGKTASRNAYTTDAYYTLSDSDDFDWFYNTYEYTDLYYTWMDFLDLCSFEDEYGVTWYSTGWDIFDEFVYYRGDLSKMSLPVSYSILRQIVPFPSKQLLLEQIKKMAIFVKNHGFPEEGNYYLETAKFMKDCNSCSRGDALIVYSRIEFAYYLAVTMEVLKPMMYVGEALLEIAFLELVPLALVGEAAELALSSRAAIAVIEAIPAVWVSRGARLAKFVQTLAEMGKAGEKSYVRIFRNYSYQKASKLFNKLTKNAVKIRPIEGLEAGQIGKVAEMGNGNYITFRNFSKTMPEASAAITLNFPKIFEKSYSNKIC